MAKKREVHTLEEALEYIAELETSLKDAISLVIKRDDQLSLAERRIFELETKLENLES